MKQHNALIITHIDAIIVIARHEPSTAASLARELANYYPHYSALNTAANLLGGDLSTEFRVRGSDGITICYEPHNRILFVLIELKQLLLELYSELPRSISNYLFLSKESREFTDEYLAYEKHSQKINSYRSKWYECLKEYGADDERTKKALAKTQKPYISKIILTEEEKEADRVKKRLH